MDSADQGMNDIKPSVWQVKGGLPPPILKVPS
jgi:hypothetical protein